VPDTLEGMDERVGERMGEVGLLSGAEAAEPVTEAEGAVLELGLIGGGTIWDEATDAMLDAMLDTMESGSEMERLWLGMGGPRVGILDWAAARVKKRARAAKYFMVKMRVGLCWEASIYTPGGCYTSCGRTFYILISNERRVSY